MPLQSTGPAPAVSVVPAGSVPLPALAAAYAAIQSRNPVICALGVGGAELDEYALFVMAHAARWAWNAAVVDGARCSLPPAALAHWRLSLALRAEVRARPLCDPEEGRYQGRGMAKLAMRWAQGAAAAAGYERWWSWSLNQNAVKAAGSGVDTRVRLLSTAAG
eukprot:gene20533-60034_t